MGLFTRKKDKTQDILEQHRELKAKQNRELSERVYYFLRGFLMNSGIKGDLRDVVVIDGDDLGYHLELHTTNHKDLIGVGGKNIGKVCIAVQKEFDIKVQLNVKQFREI